MVDGADAGAQPDRIRRRGGQFRVEDDETRTLERFLEAVFPEGLVLGAAGEVGVFAGGQGRRDTDDGHDGRVDVGPFVRTFREGGQFFDGGDIVGECLTMLLIFEKKKKDEFTRTYKGNNLGPVCQAARAQGQQQIGVDTAGVVGDLDDLGPQRMALHANPDPGDLVAQGVL